MMLEYKYSMEQQPERKEYTQKKWWCSISMPIREFAPLYIPFFPEGMKQSLEKWKLSLF